MSTTTASAQEQTMITHTCPMCQGSGYYHHLDRSSVVCPHCKGTGSAAQHKCPGHDSPDTWVDYCEDPADCPDNPVHDLLVAQA